MTNYFADCSTVEAIKKLYRKLAFEHHPDRGGSTAKMQDINKAYHEALRRAHGQRSTDAKGTEHEYNYNKDTEEAVIQQLNKTLSVVRSPAFVALVGTWLWVFKTERYDGHAEKLKALGFKWNRKRDAWCWAPYKYRGKSSRKDFAGLVQKYGYQRFERGGDVSPN